MFRKSKNKYKLKNNHLKKVIITALAAIVLAAGVCFAHGKITAKANIENQIEDEKSELIKKLRALADEESFCVSLSFFGYEGTFYSYDNSVLLLDFDDFFTEDYYVDITDLRNDAVNILENANMSEVLGLDTKELTQKESLYIDGTDFDLADVNETQLIKVISACYASERYCNILADLLEDTKITYNGKEGDKYSVTFKIESDILANALNELLSYNDGNTSYYASDYESIYSQILSYFGESVSFTMLLSKEDATTDAIKICDTASDINYNELIKNAVCLNTLTSKQRTTFDGECTRAYMELSLILPDLISFEN